MLPLLLALAAFHVPVTCDMTVPPPPNQAAQGVWHPDTQTIQLRPNVCASIDRARQGWANDTTAGALFVLGHELAHSYGISDETGADCIGSTLTGWVTHKLGVNRPTERAVLEITQAIGNEACPLWDSLGDPWGPDYGNPWRSH